MIIDSRRTKTSTDVLTELDPSVLMLMTSPGDDVNEQNGSRNVETETRQAELMQLFQEMIKSPPLRKKIMQSFNEHEMRRLFSHMLEISAAGDWIGNIIQVSHSWNIYSTSYCHIKYVFNFAERFHHSLHSRVSLNSGFSSESFQLVNVVFRIAQ